MSEPSITAAIVGSGTRNMFDYVKIAMEVLLGFLLYTGISKLDSIDNTLNQTRETVITLSARMEDVRTLGDRATNLEKRVGTNEQSIARLEAFMSARGR